MAKKSPTSKGKVINSTMTADSFTNFAARLGIGQQNLLSNSSYQYDFLTRNRTQLEAAYRTSWLVGAAVDIPAEDMTRAGISVESTMPPERIQVFQTAMLDLGIWQSLANAIRWSRLFGGAIAVMLIDGQDMSKPLNIKSVGNGNFKGLLVLDRWLLNPSMGRLITDLGPNLGKPKMYDLVASGSGLPEMKIHHSRCLRFDGLELPFYQRQYENGWGQSVIERIHDRLVAFDSASMGAAQLAYKAHLRTYSVEGLRDIIASGGEVYGALLKQIDMIRVMQSNEGMTLMDAKDKFEAHQYTFAGMSDILLQFAQQLSGALEIPMVRLFGQSPAGMNATGESDLRTYYDGVQRTQESRLRASMTTLLHVQYRSQFNEELPKDFNYKFRPLWQLSETEKGELAAKDATAVGEAYDKGIIGQKTALKELKQSGTVTGRFTNISQKEIDEAEEFPPSAEDLLDAADPEGGTGEDDPANPNPKKKEK